MGVTCTSLYTGNPISILQTLLVTAQHCPCATLPSKLAAKVAQSPPSTVVLDWETFHRSGVLNNCSGTTRLVCNPCIAQFGFVFTFLTLTQSDLVDLTAISFRLVAKFTHTRFHFLKVGMLHARCIAVWHCWILWACTSTSDMPETIQDNSELYNCSVLGNEDRLKQARKLDQEVFMNVQAALRALTCNSRSW